jgi:hypothetical protein
MHEGAVSATATGAGRINLDDSAVHGGTASVSGNSVAAIAQSNSADNGLSLSAGNAIGVSGAVASVQQAWGRVTATATTQDSDKAFAVRTERAEASQLTVSGNVFRASAGQNEAFNRQVVTASALTGSGAGAGYLPTFVDSVEGGAGSTADHAVLNQQSGSGNVTAVATPGLIGLPVGSTWGSNLSVTGNEVSAKANVNLSSNTLELATQGTLAATGTVSNAQVTQGGNTSALVGGKTGTFIGTSAWSIDGGTASVTGNSLGAVAGGNSAGNVLNASASRFAAGLSPSFQVLNQQENTASMNAAVQNATIGMALGFPHDVTGKLGAFGSTGYGYGGMNGTTATVQGNQVQASGYGNTASNSIGLSAAGGAAGAGAAIANRQVNAATISATVSGVMVGIGGGQSAGSNVVVTGNAIAAQAVGNTATNVIGFK